MFKFLNNKIPISIVIVIIIFLVLIFGIVIYLQHPEMKTKNLNIPEIKIPNNKLVIPSKNQNSTTTPEQNGLQKEIEDGKSIMWIGPHPDDEMFTAGTFAFACGDRKNKCYVLCVVSVDNINPVLGIEKRKEAIAWYTKTYLTQRIDLDFSRPPAFNWEDIKTKIFNEVETIKPDIIITFTPYGYYHQPDHIATSKIVTNIYGDLSYKPEIYYVINMDQDLPPKSQNYEYKKYPPTDVINLNFFSNKLGKTFWEAKLEIWQHYAQSIPDLQNLLNNSERLQKNDKKEYFMKVEL